MSVETPCARTCPPVCVSACALTYVRACVRAYLGACVFACVRAELSYPNVQLTSTTSTLLLLFRYEDFARRAKMMTEIHAKPKGGGEAGPATSPGGTKHALQDDGSGSTTGGVLVKKLNLSAGGEGKQKKEALKAQNKKKNLKRL
jgi:hypothetical protein